MKQHGSNSCLVVMQDRHEEAKVVLRRLHDDNKDHTFWEKEYTVLVAQLQFERDETVGVSFWHMFTNKKELKRAALAVAALTSCQTTGAQTIQVFQVTGFSFTISKLQLTCLTVRHIRQPWLRHGQNPSLRLYFPDSADSWWRHKPSRYRLDRSQIPLHHRPHLAFRYPGRVYSMSSTV